MRFNSKTIKIGLISGAIHGLIFALGMAGFDYADKQPFHLNQFLFYFITFGIIMGLTAVYTNTKKKNNVSRF
ncbi:hypothetical protein [Bizionia myxarmorum]|uniref:Uncharacterized protein n=1 Tax=Bizionia myxarmorum TaxID=291186 RepID=A0A5D0R551_9FLAO|nr:hypothetical protein [Bizionia myxarmorum]TYB76189.1 hypothetical protein ES674_11370 [Bizionia myxarmorum]